MRFGMIIYVLPVGPALWLAKLRITQEPEEKANHLIGQISFKKPEEYSQTQHRLLFPSCATIAKIRSALKSVRQEPCLSAPKELFFTMTRHA